MKKLLLGTAMAVMLCGAAYAEDNGLRALDLLGEPPGAGAMGPNRGDVVFPDGPINTPFNRGGYYGMYGNAYLPRGQSGLFGPSMAVGPGYYGYDQSSGYSDRRYSRTHSHGARSSMRSAPRPRHGTDLPGERPGVQTSPTAGD